MSHLIPRFQVNKWNLLGIVVTQPQFMTIHGTSTDAKTI
jgi:hypothetical protein